MKLVKDILIGFIKILFTALIEAVKAAVKKIDYRELAYGIYLEALPKIEAKVKDTESTIDDGAVKAISYLAEKFLKPDVK